MLCADDYGLAPGVSRGILELAAMGRISATSVMTNGLDWPAGAAALQPFEGRIGIGLHVNLTAGSPLGRMPGLAPQGRLPPLEAILDGGFTSRDRSAEIEAEIERQLEAFLADFGRLPDFVDGHQHVHVLPGVRRALFAVLARRPSWRPWLRDPTDRLASIFRRTDAPKKAATVAALALGFGRRARRQGYATNRGFSGFSPLDTCDPERIAALFEAALSRLGPSPLVMCHPGHVDAALPAIDPVLAPREAEFAYLASESFGGLVAERQLVLVPAPA